MFTVQTSFMANGKTVITGNVSTWDTEAVALMEARAEADRIAQGCDGFVRQQVGGFALLDYNDQPFALVTFREGE